MNGKKFLALQPKCKKGVNILKRCYDQIKSTILQVLENEGEIS